METKTRITAKNSAQFEANKKHDHDDPGFGVRHIVAFMGFLGLTNIYALRVNLSVAIVAMATRTPKGNVSLSDSCPIPESYDSTAETGSTGEFDWDEKTQGIILGSFFYGYALTNILGGIISERIGGRIVVGLGIIITAILTILSPWAARVSSALFMLVRILEGCAEGVAYSGLNTLVVRWYPTQERSKFMTIIYAGMHFGTVITLPISSVLCASDTSHFLGGWPAVFYVFGIFGLIWGVFWFWLVRDNPDDHPHISEAEAIYIAKGCPDTQERFPVPWRAILGSRYVWIMAVMHFGNNWGFFTLLTELPTYLDRILHINLKSNGLLSALPYLGAWLFSIVYSLVIDKLIRKDKMTLLYVRRISMIICGYGPMICLIGLCFVSCNSVVALLILLVSGSFNGALYCGLLSSHADLTPRFAGTLLGFTNTIGTIPGFVAPAITGALTQGNQTLMAWRTVFLISAGVYAATTTLYVFFISAERQEWNEPSLKSKNDLKLKETEHIIAIS